MKRRKVRYNTEMQVQKVDIKDLHAYSVDITVLANFVLDKVKGKHLSVHECDVRVYLWDGTSFDF